MMRSERCVGMKAGLGTALARNPFTVLVLLYAWRPSFTHDLLLEFESAHMLRWKCPVQTVEIISSDVGIDCAERL